MLCAWQSGLFLIINKKIEETTFNILNELNIKAPKDIDILKIANHLNVDVQSAILDNSISGLFVIKDSKPYIRYNVTESERRKRFTIAHELGHFVLHKDIPLFIDKNQNVKNKFMLGTAFVLVRVLLTLNCTERSIKWKL